jgi:hypothetical protein
VLVLDLVSAGFFVDFDVLVVDFAGVLEFFVAVVVLPVFELDFVFDFDDEVFAFGSGLDFAVVFDAVLGLGVGFGVALVLA